ncbi:MAG: threonine synthase [Bacteroidota bacterium]
MNLYSTKSRSKTVSLKEAVLQGLPPDNGLYMLEDIPVLPPAFFDNISAFSFPELAFQVARNLIGTSINDQNLKTIIDRSIVFDAPLVSLDPNTHVLELFHGPTLAFKDFGARFMAELMSFLVQNDNRKLTILVATSGDTGGAVAKGFYQTEGIEVIILYPSGKVSALQEKQLTTLGGNITALEIQGTFDDCQALVKQAFLDSDLQRYLWLTSANSINIARLIPQSFYYFRAYQQLKNKHEPFLFVVPSGNFGNLTAGLMAKKMGMPVAKFIAATNVNDVVPEYLESGVFHPRSSVPTLSNAMDVGNPSNFARIMDLYGADHEEVTRSIEGYAFTDLSTKEAIKELYDRFEYVIDPHGAVGYLALKEYQLRFPQSSGIILATAHPGKFVDTVEETLGFPVHIPERLSKLADLPKDSIVMDTDFGSFKAYLIGRE